MNTLVETPTVSLIYIANPLTPAESRVTTVHQHQPDRTLAQYLGPLEGEWAVSVSGRMIERDQWAEVRLAPNDCVVVAPILMGGGKGTGKTILRLVALVALTYFTMGAGTMSLAGMTGLSGGGLAAAQVGVMAVGSMAINAVLPPAKPKVSGGSDYDSSSTYGIDGPKNQSTKNIPVPVVYGETWFAGNIIQCYVENVGDTQYLNMLINAGEGPIESISDIYVNEQPIANFQNVEIFTRLGTADQTVIPYFNDIIKPVNRNVELTDAYIAHTVQDAVDKLRVDISMPAGIGRVDDEDGMVSYTTAFIAEIREVGGTWGPFEPVDPNATTQAKDPARISISGKQMSALRKSYYSGELDRTKRYELRFKHTESNTDDSNILNKITVTDINSIQYDDINYKHTALLGLRIKLDEQLSGIPSVMYRVKGLKVRVYDAASNDYVVQWTNNPAWIALDVLTNPRYGGGVKWSRIKLEYFRKWAQYCEDNKLYWNGAIDQQSNLWDALTPIYKVGRAMPVRSGTRFQVAIMGKKKPVQLFTVGNIKKSSLKIDWMAADERANEVSVTFYDKENFGKEKTVIVPNMKARERGEDRISTDLTLYGVDNVDQATREGTLAMNMQALLKTVSFEAPLESIACTLGDVVSIQHDMPRWGIGGLLDSGSTTNLLKLDRPVTFDESANYVAMVRHDQVLQWEASVDTVLGNVVFLGNGFNASNFERFRRLVHLETRRDYQVVEPVIDTYGRHGVRLDSAVGITAGDTVQLIDTDVIETRPVVAKTGEVTELTVTTPFSVAPRAETPWAFGPSETVVTSITVMDISGKSDLWRTISGIEYSDDAYSDEVQDYKVLPISTSKALGDVTFLGFKEKRYLQGGMYVSDIEFSWSHESPNYVYAEVYIQRDDEAWELIDANASIATVKVSSGTLRVKLVPVNLEGVKPALTAMTEHSYVVEAGVPDTPPVVSSVYAGSITKDIIEIKWGDIDEWAASQNIYKYQVWAAIGKDASLLDAQMLAVTGNNHYAHVGLAPDTYYTFWIRTVNILASGKYSEFTPVAGLSLKTNAADTISDLFPGGISLTDLDSDLQSTVSKTPSLEDLAETISRVSSLVEDTTDGHKQEIYNRKEEMGQLKAQVKEEIATAVGPDSAIAQKVDELSVQVNDDIAAAIKQEQLARATADDAIAAQVNEISAKVNDDITAAIKEEAAARADADSAMAGQIETLTAQVNEDLSAAIKNEQQARADGDSALAKSITTLTTTVDGHTSSIEQQLTSIDGLSSQYTVKINNDGNVVGFGLASTAKNDGTNASEFSIVADRFKIVKPGTKTGIPVFTVDTASNRVVMGNAFIGDIQSDNYVAGVSGWCIKK